MSFTISEWSELTFFNVLRVDLIVLINLVITLLILIKLKCLNMKKFLFLRVIREVRPFGWLGSKY